MQQPSHHSISFYKALSCLFFAIASIDRRLVRGEKQAIFEIVKKDWALSSDRLDSRETIFQTLKQLIEAQTDPNEAYSHFTLFYEENKSLFPMYLRRKIIRSADCIAESYSGVNKSELILLTKLRTLLRTP